MIQVIKLTTGDEVVGSITEQNEFGIAVSNPLAINYIQNRLTQNPVVFMQRFMPFSAQEDIHFKHENILTVADPVPGLEAYYKQTLSNIQETVDTSIVTSLADAIDTKNNISLRKQDFYESILEGMENKGHKH